jgi:putative FmdB family regulatory protein
MPLYDYECENCGRYEVSQRITEPALTRCERCKSRKIQRLISSSHFALKGGGWYSDLYSGASNQKGGAKAESKKSDAA